eukprot:TRINITY_DN63750_c0_g1_i1.p1 TRINITY_DN63750_c0_g1~~TRINITY_DN63750_c0_g1_i1.p1  ORF type:complete len:297 (+),score=60.60 TRINITY_DN63750_c0_g1_i1:58-948(+)
MGNRACKCLEGPATASADKNPRRAEETPAEGDAAEPAVSFFSHMEAQPIDSMVFPGSFNDCSSVSSCGSDVSIAESYILLDRIDTARLEAAVADNADEEELVSIIHSEMMESKAAQRDPLSPRSLLGTPLISKIDEEEQDETMEAEAGGDSHSDGAAATPRSCKIGQVDALMTPPGSPAKLIADDSRPSTAGHKRRQSRQSLLAAVDQLVAVRRKSLSSTSENNRKSIETDCRRHRRSLLKAAEVVEAADVPDPKLQEMLARLERALERARQATIPIQFYPAYPAHSSTSSLPSKS